ncbi:MAG: ABC transporter permease, partial [Paracoccaceae bacterium]|nr:ABC transporter permease [Paracoccaceae bacterium]
MLTFTIRRLVLAVPTLLFISLVIFMLLQLAPGDPMAQVPLTVPPEVKEKMREALGLGAPVHVQFFKWIVQFFWVEPQVLIDHLFGTTFSEGQLRVLSWQTRSPVMDIVVQRLPQTLWVVGMSYVLGVLIALPIGIYSAYRQYSAFDQIGTFVSMVGFSVPTFFTGVLLIVIFSVNLGWFPSIYDTTHKVTDWDSFVFQLRQMIMPVMVLALYNAAQISRFMRASMLDNLNQDYVRTARAKGLGEKTVVLVHVLRNSMIPVVTVIALGVPQVFGGAISVSQEIKGIDN